MCFHLTIIVIPENRDLQNHYCHSFACHHHKAFMSVDGYAKYSQIIYFHSDAAIFAAAAVCRNCIQPCCISSSIRECKSFWALELIWFSEFSHIGFGQLLLGIISGCYTSRYTVMGDSGVMRGEFIPTVLDWVPGPSNNRPTKAAHLTLKVMSKLDTQSPHGQDIQNMSNVLLKGCKQSAAILVSTSLYICVWSGRLGCLLHPQFLSLSQISRKIYFPCEYLNSSLHTFL